MSVLRSLPRTVQLARRAASTSAPLTVSSTRTNASAPILANIEASWKSLPAEEQYEVYQQLEEIQKRDWKELTIDEKKAGEWGLVNLGPGLGLCVMRHDAVELEVDRAGPGVRVGATSSWVKLHTLGLARNRIDWGARDQELAAYRAILTPQPTLSLSALTVPGHHTTPQTTP
jgi:hypothetical protein